MKTKHTPVLARSVALVSLLLTLAPQPPAFAQGTVFTYQGRLNDGGSPANGSYDLRLILYTSDVSGSQVGPILTNTPTLVSNGLFTSSLDFGTGAFSGADRYLEIAVRPNSGSAFTPLVPRQRITAAPYAITAGNLAGVVANNSINASLSVVGGGSNNVIQADSSGSTIGGGLNNLVEADSTESTIAGGNFNLIGTESSDATVGGGAGNVIVIASASATISGGFANSIDSSAYSAIVGGKLNTVAQDSAYSVIGGGKQNHILQASDGSSIGGGYVNTIEGSASVLGGGEANSLQSDESFLGSGFSNQSIASSGSVLGGGEHNLIALDFCSFLGGGQANSILTNADFGALAGGQYNSVVGIYGAIPGGDQNSATNYGFAAGHRAKANDNGSFVWADSTDADFASTVTNQVNMRASGGYRLFSNGAASVGVQVAAGGNSWSILSDRNQKENFQPVDCQALLEKVVALPVTTWNLKSQPLEIRHIGAMAQNFKSAFAVGEDDRHISTSDADGVTLAAIQGLNQKLEDRAKTLASELKQKETEIAKLNQRLDALEQLVLSQYSN